MTTKINEQELLNGYGFISMSELVFADTNDGIEVTICTPNDDFLIVDDTDSPVRYVTPEAAIFALVRYDLSAATAHIQYIMK